MKGLPRRDRSRERVGARRGDVAARLLRLMWLLAGERWLPPLQQLARELEVHQRTVRRYLAVLETAPPFPAPFVGVPPRRGEDTYAEPGEARYVNHADDGGVR